MRLPLLLLNLLLLTGLFVSGQTANNNNSFPAASSANPAYLGSSTIATPLHKLYSGGSIKSFNTGNSGFSSPSLYLANTTASTGRTYFINSNSAGLLRFVDSNANADRLVINSSGNVGIGTGSPTSKLHVNGTSKFTDQLQVNKVAINSDIPAYLSGQSAGSFVNYQINGAISTVNYHYAQNNVLNFQGYGTTVSAYASAATKSDLYLHQVNAALSTGYYFSGSDNTVTVTGGSNIGSGGVAVVRTGGHIDATATVSKYYGVLIDEVYGSGTADKYGLYQVEAAARNYFAGKVSIGTTATSDYKLDVNGTGRVNSSLLVGSSPTSWLGESAGYALQVVGTNNSTAGNVGIHIQNRTTASSNAVLSFGVGPTDVLKSSIAQDLSRLTIYGSNDLRLAPSWNGNIEFYSPLSSSVLGLIKGTNGNMLLGTTTDAGYKLDVNGSTRLNNSLVVNTDGTVALGTVTTYPSGYKFAVAGNIIAEKVRVKLQSSTWPDYVFNKKHKLPTLREIELFIQQHQHLPGVPSAAEVEKEGIDLGDNQAVLLKKIEELTLHLIELSKKVDQLKEENKIMKRQLQNK